jgi:pyruvate/2-oxoglutarate dehydrogenase complex dihydrolipoamide dehydrogenase (E3) component
MMVDIYLKNKTLFFHGAALYEATDGGYQIKVAGSNVGSRRHIIVAASSERPPISMFRSTKSMFCQRWSSSIEQVPKLLLIGAGVIGLEMGSVWRRWGPVKTVLEGPVLFLGRLINGCREEAQKPSRSRD